MSMYLLNPRELVFTNLYDNIWACIVRPRRPHERPVIIFPSEFQPETGKKYKCTIRETWGTFTYNNIDYHLCYASLCSSETASVFDVIEFKVAAMRTTLGSLGNALEGRLPDINNLPENRPIIDLQVKPDLRNGGYMFAPTYHDKDPEAGDKPSMRFYHLEDPEKMHDFELGEMVSVRVMEVRSSGRVNQKGSVMLNVIVDPIPKKKRASAY